MKQHDLALVHAMVGSAPVCALWSDGATTSGAKLMTKFNPYASDKDAEQFMRYAAYNEGISYHDWCDKYGIVDDANARKVRRHDAPLNDWYKVPSSDPITRRPRPNWRGGRDGDRDLALDPPFPVRLTSDMTVEPPDEPSSG